MYMENKNENGNENSLLRRGDLSLEGLQGRQSVRATFQLPDQMIALLGAVASQFGVKQKSLLDSLLEDSETIVRLTEGEPAELLPEAAKKRKTFVISKRTLQILEETARKSSLPRDQVLAISISRLFPVVAEEQARHEKRVALLAELQNWQRQGAKLLQTAVTELDEDDVAVTILETMLVQCRQQLKEMENLVERGRNVANLQLDESDMERPDNVANRRRRKMAETA